MIDPCLLVVAAAAGAVADGLGERCGFLRDHSGGTVAGCAGGAVVGPKAPGARSPPGTRVDSRGAGLSLRAVQIRRRQAARVELAPRRVTRGDRDHCRPQLATVERAWGTR